MREINAAERASVSGAISARDVVSWFGNLLKPPAKPAEPWVNPFPSESASSGVVTGIGVVAVAAGAAIAVTAAGQLGLLSVFAGAAGLVARLRR
ncbi:hypothetical protein [Burkholderia ambifaria]|uniref:hypothetical protein n=1 Tax=Burkholderia ambifaria TaxID=152480 RepID=UPI000F80D4AD|nr:hypothetical protein [Burkholderia ambifaria]UEP25795.1 hypothetical protein LL999_33045 [Burkholderia ambifaria]WAS58546.1 hypothetical protein MK974_32475 [Burkholderia ambifaria]WDR97718.1 hypothetical protein OR985_02860 [Burkholderia ambifaria]